MIRSSSLVYGLLLAAWAAIVGWQPVEHARVKQSERAALVNRARDITTTLGVVVRSQRRLVSQERLESALKELVKTGELKSVALLNVAGEVVASAGAPVDLETKGTPHSVERGMIERDLGESGRSGDERGARWRAAAHYRDAQA
jgi:hypothetical protein